MNRYLHELRCSPSLRDSSSQRQNSYQNQPQTGQNINLPQNYAPSINLSRQTSQNQSQDYQPNVSDYPRIPSQYKKETFKQPTVIRPDPNPTSIVCPKCTLPLKINELDQHMKNCDYVVCRFC